MKLCPKMNQLNIFVLFVGFRANSNLHQIKVHLLHFQINQRGQNEPNNDEITPENHNEEKSPSLEKEPENEDENMITETTTQNENVNRSDDQSAEIVSAASIDSLLDFGV